MSKLQSKYTRLNENFSEGAIMKFLKLKIAANGSKWPF